MPILVLNPINRKVTDQPSAAHGSDWLSTGFSVSKEFL
jgi:hypothetical protein